MSFNPDDPDIQTAIDMMRDNDKSDEEIMDTLMSELDLSEDNASEALEANK